MNTVILMPYLLLVKVVTNIHVTNISLFSIKKTYSIIGSNLFEFEIIAFRIGTERKVL